MIWSYAGQSGNGIGCVESSPTIYAGNVYIGARWYGGAAQTLTALNAATGEFLWYQTFGAEIRATCAAADNALYVGIDTGTLFYKRNAGNGGPIDEFYAGDYFVGSAALCSADLVFVGNDNYNFYALRQSGLYPALANYYTGAYHTVRSSPAISCAAETGARWTYVLSRGSESKVYAFRTQR